MTSSASQQFMQNWEIYSNLNVKMLRFKFKIICIFVLYLIIQVNYGYLTKSVLLDKLAILSVGKKQINQTGVTVYFDKAKCVNNNCCDDFGKLLGVVICKKVYKLYSNEFPDIKHLPGKVFQKKHFQSIVIEAPDVTVDSNVLEGMSALDTFSVERSSIKAIPDFKFVKDSIREISIVNSLLTALKGENLQNLTMLEVLSFSKNSIDAIEPNALKGTVNLEVLDLSHNLLTFIPENLLDPMKRLESFTAEYDNLLNVNNVFTVTRPLAIILKNNNIRDISSALQFNFKIDKISGRVRLFKCSSHKDYRSVFRSLFAITTLDLRNNSLKETSQPIFSCLHRIPYTSTSVLEIHHFKLHENNIKNLNFLLRYLIINRLEVPKNQIEYLTDEDFKYTVGIAHLELWENKIKRIDTEAFRPLRPHLHYLDMSWNLITSLNGSVRYLIKLSILRLGSNSIKSFATDEFLGLQELNELNVENNQIKTIGLFQQLHRLRYLVVKGNDIESVSPNLVSETLQRMDLAGNPIKCNCLFDLFLRRLNTSSVRTDIHTICSKHVSAVSVQKKFNSQDLCTYRCTEYKNGSYVFVDCSSKNLAVVPQFPEINFMDVENLASFLLPIPIKDRHYRYLIKNVASYTFHIEDKILGINLENNNLESLDTAQLPPNLIQLYLSENKLRRLPKFILENQLNLKQLTLSENPWKCDCDAIEFKKWLTSEKEKIKDIDNVRCGIIGNEDSRLNRRVIINLTDFELCPSDIALIVLAPSGALTVVIFCLVSTILYTRYKLHLKVFLYSHGITFVREEDLDYNKIFDAFISFSDNDGKFVTNDIISVIEKRNPNIHLCFHIRDFIAGELITTNITRAVQNSKKTVLILSNNFLESEWCLLEARTAHSQAMEDKVNRIIVIKVGDLPREMDPLIKAYLVSTTYITWGESSFWNKLLYVLPSHVCGRGNVPDNMEDNETVV